MTLAEFLAPLSTLPYRDRILALLYYFKRYDHTGPVTVQQIRQGLRRARTPSWKKINVADVLARSREFVDSPGSAGSRLLWEITGTGEARIRKLLSLPAVEPEIEHDIGALQKVVKAIGSVESREYVEEAVKCLQARARRATIVFLWSGGIRMIQGRVMAHPASKRNAAIRKHDPKARSVGRIDDFAYIKDRVVILAAQELGILDKHEKDALTESLNLRNRCGHPGKWRPGDKKVSAFVEDIVSIVFG